MTDRFCPLPWQHLATHPAGYVTLCCEADHTNLKSASFDRTDPTIFDGQPSFYNLKIHSISDTMNSESFREVRKQFLNREIPEACRPCFEKEAKGLQSKRLRERRNFPDFSESYARWITNEDGSIPLNLEFVELRLGNLCNARCVTCNPLSSSQWRSDYLKISKELPFVADRYQMMDKGKFVTWPTGFRDSNVFELDWPDNEKFWEELLENAKTIQVLYINGGEPTLIKNHWWFLEKLIERGYAKNITLTYSINATNLPSIAPVIWGEFKKVVISCSVDDLKDRNHYIRYPSDWDIVLNNIKLLKTMPVELSICQTISAMNYNSISEFWDFFQSMGIWVHHNFLRDPSYFSPLILPLEFRQKVHETLHDKLPSNTIEHCKSTFEEPQDIDGLKKFKQFIENIDKIRGLNFENTFSEVAQWLK